MIGRVLVYLNMFGDREVVLFFIRVRLVLKRR